MISKFFSSGFKTGFLCIFSVSVAAALLAGCQHNAPIIAPAPTQKKPGQILKMTKRNITNPTLKSSEAFRITYLTTDGIGGKEMVPVTAAVYLPPGPPPREGWPVIAWAHGLVGIAPHCAPSLNPADTAFQEWLERGFAVVATDYRGLGATGTIAYLNTQVEAYDVLDSVRAVLGASLHLQNKVILMGHSQGAGAVFSAASYAPAYAPELNIRGTVTTGIPYMTATTLKALVTDPAKAQQPDSSVVYALLAVATYQAQNPRFDPSSILLPKATPSYKATSKLCLTPLKKKVEQDKLTQTNSFQTNALAKLAPAFKTMTYLTLKLKQPLFVGIGDKDRDIPPAMQLALVHDTCTAGTIVQAHLYHGKDHGGTYQAALPDVTAFIRTVMGHGQITPICRPIPQ